MCSSDLAYAKATAKGQNVQKPADAAQKAGAPSPGTSNPASTPTPPAAPKSGSPIAVAPTPTPSPAAKPAASGTILTNVFVTAYTFFDNTPPGSATIAFPKSAGYPTLRNLAGGTGTHADPITLAVGHVISGGKDTPDFAPGTRFYFPHIRKYAIVEDTCGDGGAPQNVPCHSLSTAQRGATLWLDLWIGGSAGDSSGTVQACANTVTNLYTVVKDPSANYAVHAGPVFQNGYCIQPGNKSFGNTLVTL